MFEIPKKPTIKEYERKQEARKFVILPYRAALDKSLTRAEVRHLMVLASYCSNNGFTYVSLSTLARDNTCSIQNASKYIKRLESKGYVKTHRKGVNGIRGCLRQIVFDESLTPEDIIAISNVPLPTKPIQHESDETMKRKPKQSKAINSQEVEVTRLDYQEGLLVVSHLIKSESDLLKLERLISQGITRNQLLESFKA